MKKIRHLLLLALLGSMTAPNAWAQEEPTVPKKKQKQQEDYEKGKEIFPAKKLNNPSIGVFVGSAHILGDLRSYPLDLGIHKGKVPYASDWLPGANVGINFQKALGHVISFRVQAIRGWVSGQSYLKGVGNSNPVWSSFYGAKPYVVYNYRMDNFEGLGQLVVHLNNVNFYRKETKWNYYLGIGGGAMLSRTMINATSDELGQTVKKENAFDYNTPININSSNGSAVNFSWKNPTSSSGIDAGLGWINDDWKIALKKLYGDNGSVNLLKNALFGKKYYETEVADKSAGYLAGKSGKAGRVFNPVGAVSMGVKYKLGKRIDLGYEQTYRFIANDNLDGVSRTIQGAKTASLDNYITTNLSLNVALGKNPDAQPLWWSNPLVQSYETLRDTRGTLKSLGDSDEDGVADIFDKDPNTPDGSIVDGAGRPLDADGDGVPDNVDKERFSTSGSEVDGDGVARDSDHDGVADIKDDEKNSAAGAYVDAKGRTIKMPTVPTCTECTKDLEARIKALEEAAKKPQPPVIYNGGNSNTVVTPACSFGSVYFDAGSTKVKQSYYAEMQQIANYLANNPSSNVVVVGHPEGKGAANVEVARKRAQAVVNFLTGNMSVDKSRLSVSIGGIDTGMSSSKNPKNDAITSMNRRVDFECR